MEPDIRREATGFARNWWLFLITGVAWLMIGVLVLRFNVTSVATVGILLGMMFLGAAINEFLASTTVSGGWKFVHIALGVLFVLGSLWGFIRPIDAACFGLGPGLPAGADGIDARDRRRAVQGNPVWWLGLTVSILEFLLAMWVSQQYYDARITLIRIWVGFMAIFRGILQIVMAFELHHAKKSLETAA